MTTFDGREQAFENKFAHDQETEFKILARTSHLVGLWAAEKLQLAAEKAESYAETLVELVVKPQPELAVKEQVHKDLAAQGIEIPFNEVESAMERLYQKAKEQVINVG